MVNLVFVYSGLERHRTYNKVAVGLFPAFNTNMRLVKESARVRGKYVIHPVEHNAITSYYVKLRCRFPLT